MVFNGEWDGREGRTEEEMIREESGKKIKVEARIKKGDGGKRRKTERRLKGEGKEREKGVREEKQQ